MDNWFLSKRDSRYYVFNNMVTDELRAYIRTQLQMSVSREAIVSSLRQQGWSESDIEMGFPDKSDETAVASASHTPPVVASDEPESHAHNKVRYLAFGSIGLLLVAVTVVALAHYGSASPPILNSGALVATTTDMYGCEDPAQDDPRTQQLSDLRAQMEKLSNEMASSSSKNLHLDAYDKIDSLQKQYNSLTIAIAESQVASTSPALISRLQDMYCGPNAASAWIQSDAATTTMTSWKDLSDSSFKNLSCGLYHKTYSESRLPDALYYLGFKMGQAGKFDGAVSWYTCAAGNYYDLPAMYKLAGLYYQGSAGIKQEFPNMTVNTTMPVDLLKSYFWEVALFQANKFQNSDFMLNDSWNVIALLDTLQQDKDITDQQLWDTEQQAIRFVSKRYPAVLNDKSYVYNHSMRVMITNMQAKTSAQ